MKAQPLVSVAEAQERAKRRVPKAVYDSLVAGTEKGLTVADNLTAFDQIGFRPRIAADLPSQRDLTTKVFGQELSMPVIVSPAGAQAIDPAGEVAVARAAADAGVAMGLSSFASKPFEDVVEANPNAFWQLYWIGDRDQIAARIQRAKDAGAKGLILTLDWSFATRRDWGSPQIPERVSLATIARFAPMAIAHPGWALRFLRGGIPDLTVPNVAATGETPPTFQQAFVQWVQTPLPTWQDVEWVREQWDGPLLIKGVFHPDDARHAVDVGADAISVSNHGGNNLDGAPASIRALPAVVDAVGDDIEVLLDGGVRRGGDVVKALALGARAVLVGRLWLWGLAARGEQGVGDLLEVLRSGIDETLIGLGHGSVKDITSADLVIPDGFAVEYPEVAAPSVRAA